MGMAQSAVLGASRTQSFFVAQPWCATVFRKGFNLLVACRGPWFCNTFATQAACDVD